jgi:hypothetical protein
MRLQFKVKRATQPLHLKMVFADPLSAQFADKLWGTLEAMRLDAAA